MICVSPRPASRHPRGDPAAAQPRSAQRASAPRRRRQARVASRVVRSGTPAWAGTQAGRSPSLSPAARARGRAGLVNHRVATVAATHHRREPCADADHDTPQQDKLPDARHGRRGDESPSTMIDSATSTIRRQSEPVHEGGCKRAHQAEQSKPDRQRRGEISDVVQPNSSAKGHDMGAPTVPAVIGMVGRATQP